MATKGPHRGIGGPSASHPAPPGRDGKPGMFANPTEQGRLSPLCPPTPLHLEHWVSRGTLSFDHRFLASEEDVRYGAFLFSRRGWADLRG